MPISVPIRDALTQNYDLVTVVHAIYQIAVALANLAEKHNISHRDIKPDNLFQYHDKWVIGDFGLVSIPDTETLTEDGRRLGPANFLAPEMIEHANKADGKAADVYSLAKTLFVLAVNKDNYPPPGEQRRDRPDELLSHHVSHPRAYILDRLIERATRTNPIDRPTMLEFSDELSAWLISPTELKDEDTIGAILSGLNEKANHSIERNRIQKEINSKRYEEYNLEGDKSYTILVSALQQIKDSSGLPNELLHLRVGGGNNISMRRAEHISHDLERKGKWSSIHLRVPWYAGETHYNKVGYLILKNSLIPTFQWMSVIYVAGVEDAKLYLFASHQIFNGKEKYHQMFWYDFHIVDLGSAQQDITSHQLANKLIQTAEDAAREFIKLSQS